jgi:hypothetical protein
MNHVQKTQEANRRLAVLVSLSVATKYRLTLPDLRAVVDGAGYPASLAVIGADAAFLDETGLVEFDRASQQIKLTERGLEVAGGYAEIPGVGKPGPEA